MTRHDLEVAALTVVCVAVLLVAAALTTFYLGIFNVAADAPHTAVVSKLIAFVRERSIEARAENLKVPSLDNPTRIREGAEHYAEMCVSCHLGPGLAENEMRPGMNPKPPVLAALPPEEPSEQFWIIKHGLKMTAMPAWGTTHSDEEIWNMVAFLQKLPRLSAKQYRAIAQDGHPHHDHMEE
jgi:mono/diheme cytochrome c family protein